MLEKEVVGIWQRLANGRRRLTTEQGSRLRVIYPGRPNDEHGGDFRDAVIRLDGVTARGQIEIHVRAADWYAHGHHRDAAYNGTVLHVVYRQGAPALPAIREDGRALPTIVLGRLRRRETPVAPPPRCCPGGGRLSPAEITGLLGALGEARFRAKAGRFAAELHELPAGEVLYRGIMGGLGYSANRVPFAELARRVPLSTLQALETGRQPAAVTAAQQRLLLGVAGLEHGAAADYPGIVPLTAADWQLVKIRPANSPVRRIAAMSLLLERYRARGLVAGLLELVNSGERALLTDGMVVRRGGKALLGAERAAVIAVNVLLPFAYAWACRSGSSDRANDILGLYRRYPRLAANAIERQVLVQLGIPRQSIKSVCQQQGLIHIYQELCTRGGCRVCPGQL